MKTEIPPTTDTGWRLSGEAAFHRAGGKIERMPGLGQWRTWRCCRCKSVSPKPNPDDLGEFVAWRDRHATCGTAARSKA